MSFYNTIIQKYKMHLEAKIWFLFISEQAKMKINIQENTKKFKGFLAI